MSKKQEYGTLLAVGVPGGYQPTKYTFKKGEKVKKNSLGMAEDYPYDWYIGAVDSCQVGLLYHFNFVREGYQKKTGFFNDIDHIFF